MLHNPTKYQFTTHIKVRDYEIDSQGIVNNAIYLHYLELTRHEFCEAAGTSFRDMQQRGIDPVLRNAELEYLNALTHGDEVLSCLTLTRHGARFVFTQDLFRLPDMLPVLRAKITVVSLENHRLSRGDALASEFSAYLNPVD